jgi:hypothetical protein
VTVCRWKSPEVRLQVDVAVHVVHELAVGDVGQAADAGRVENIRAVVGSKKIKLLLPIFLYMSRHICI